jgi:hypothetical protein
MAQTVKLKRSAVAAKVPLTSDLALGELAVNTNDGVLYTLMNDGTNKIVQLGGQAVSATVTAGTNAQGQGPLTANVNVVNTTAANPSGVTLPTALQGESVYIYNRGTNPINVYPATGAQIDALGTNTSIQIAVGGWLQFNASSTTQWYSSFSASVSLSANNAFTGANTFTNTTGQTFRQAATQDGIIIQGRAGGTGSFDVSLTTATLSADRTLTLPNVTGTVVTTGDTGTVTGTMIATNTVVNADLAQVATATFKGRTTAGTGDVEDLTATQATALLNTFTSTVKGLAPLSGGGTTNFLRADGTWAVPAGGGGGVDYGKILATQYGAAMP